MSIIKWLRRFERGEFAWGSMPRIAPDESLTRRSGGCWCGFSTLDQSWKAERNTRAAASERFLTTTGKWLGSVIILQPWSSSLCEPRWQKVSIWAAAGLPDHRRE